MFERRKNVKKIISLILSFLIIISCLPVAVMADEGAYDEDGKYVYRNNTYDFPMLGDPQDLPDEQFFGKWDAENEVWETPSYFNYDTDEEFLNMYPDFEPVVAAVKQGDYDLAKQALMDYYTPKKYNYTGRSKSYSNLDYYTSEFAARNFYAVQTQNGFSRGIASVDSTEWQEIEVDVLDLIKNSVNTGQSTCTIVLMSMDKSNTPAEIKSRESKEPATITIMIDGSPKIIETCEDTYIQAGNNGSSNFGGEDVLYAQEYGYVGHWDANNLSSSILQDIGKQSGDWGESSTPTKRAYLKFDILDLNTSFNYESATLKFKARVAPGEEYDLTSKELAVYEWADNNWSEMSVCWKTFTDWLALSANDQVTWDYATTQSTSTKGKICYFHRGNAIAPIATLYEVTNDDKYAYTFLRQQMGLINNIGVNKSIMNCLDMSGHVRRWGDAFIKCWGSESLTPEVFTAILKHYVEMTEFIKVNWIERKSYVNNWASYATLATYTMAVMYPELDYADGWMEITKKDNASLLIGGEVRGSNNKMHLGMALRDGSCIELGQGYIGTLLGTFSTPLIFQKRTGGESPLNDESIEQIKAIVKNMLYQSAPGYRGFHMGDSMDYNETIVDTMSTWYNLLLGDDPEVEYVVTGGKKGSLPEFTSISYPLGLRTYMRTGWSDDDIGLAFTAKCEGSHGHSDILSFSMFAYDRFLLTDQSYGSTQTGTIMDYMKSAKQHNLVTINDGDVPKLTDGKDGVEEEQELNDLYNMTTYSSKFFDDADYNQRSILFLKNQKFFIVNDYVVPTNKTDVNKYTQFWHMLPDSGIYITEDGKNEIRSKFSSGANVIVAGVDTDSMYDIYLDDSIFSPTDGAFIASKKGVYEKREKGNVSYSTVVYPVAPGESVDIQTSKIDVGISDNKASALWVRITDKVSGSFDDYYYYHLNDVSAKKEVKVGEYSTDADAILVEEDENGNVVSVFIYNGTYIKSPFYTDEYLFISKNPKTLAYKLNGSGMIEISADKVIIDPDNVRTAFSEDDLKDLTIYVGTKSKGAIYNTNIVSGTSKSGGYIYFGDEPIFNGTETEDSTTGSGTSNPNHGGGGGGGGAVSKPPVVEPPVDNPPVVEPPVVEPIDPVTPSYDDVNKTDWFYSYVTELSDKGVVSGDGTGNFAPGNNVTREQFLKMLIEAADIEALEDENVFADVIADAWYKPYVLKAKNFGIVNGVSDTEFGIGSNITRQDMAVMISRTIEKLGIKIDAAEVDEFADNAMVSDYAKDAVSYMKSIGLIEGNNNEFRPLDKLTRAESAKVIYELLKLIDSSSDVAE